MRPIGYFLLLFSCISTNMIYSMNFSTQKEQRHPQTQVGHHYVSQEYAKSVADFYAKQNHPPAQTQWYAQSVAQRYAEQHQTRQCTQAAPQPQFRPPVSVVHNHSTFRPWPPPLINASINFPEPPSNLSNPNKPYDFQFQEKKKKSKPPENPVATALIELRNSTNPSDHKFTLKCPRCDQKFSSKLESNTKRNLVTHARRKKHPLTKQEIKNCMYNVNKSKKCTHFTASCPYQNSCKHVSKVTRKGTLKITLLRHINSKHFNNQKRTIILENLRKDFNKYFEEHGKTIIVFNPNFVLNSNKKESRNIRTGITPQKRDNQKKGLFR